MNQLIHSAADLAALRKLVASNYADCIVALKLKANLQVGLSTLTAYLGVVALLILEYALILLAAS